MDSTRPFSFEVSASELPESLVARFPERPSGNERLVITVEPAQTDEEKFLALKKEIEEGLADSAAGRVVDAKEVFKWLKELYPPV